MLRIVGWADERKPNNFHNCSMTRWASSRQPNLQDISQIEELCVTSVIK